MKKLAKTLLTLSVFALMISPAMAFDPGACKEDSDKLCKGVKMGDGRIKECLMKHADKLSEGCKANLFDAAVKKKENEAKKD